MICTDCPQFPAAGLMPVTNGIAGSGVAVGVVGPGVLVGSLVVVGVAVAPRGGEALKPLVMHGCRPSAKNVQL